VKKVMAIILSLFSLLTFSLAVVGCNKAEEQKSGEPAKTEAPAPAPASGTSTAAPATTAEPAATTTTK